MTDEIYQATRVVNFFILFISFMLMIYKGAFNLAVGGKLEWDRMLNLFWVILAVYSVGEVLYLSVSGGPRIFMQTVVAVLQLYVVAFHFNVKREDA